MCGSRQPAPITSQALSAAAAISGRPAGMPVASAASRVISPSRLAGGVRSGRMACDIGTACHFQSLRPAQRSRL